MSGQHPLSDITVIIDEPIGSLDANHLFNTYRSRLNYSGIHREVFAGDGSGLAAFRLAP
jgi:hypothetical protein